MDPIAKTLATFTLALAPFTYADGAQAQAPSPSAAAPVSSAVAPASAPVAAGAVAAPSAPTATAPVGSAAPPAAPVAPAAPTAATLPPGAPAPAAAISPAPAVGSPPPVPVPPPPPAGFSAPPPPPPAAFAAPPPPPAGFPAPPPTDKVQFVPDDPSVTLLRRAGVRPVARFIGGPYSWWYERQFAPVYSPVCTGPCTVPMAPGEYQLALSKSGRVIPAAPVIIDGPSSVRGEFVDRSGLRVIGWVIDAAGLVVATVLVVASYHSDDTCDDEGDCSSGGSFDGPTLAAGAAVLLGSVIVGGFFLGAHDEARISVVPLTPPVGAAREATVAALGAEPGLQGAALRIQF